MTKQRMNVLVTGGAGFIGSNTVDFLLAQGLKIKVVDDLSSGTIENLPLKHPNLTFVEADIRNTEIMAKELKDVTHVLHLAAQVSGDQSIQEPQDSFGINVCGFVHLINIIRNINPKIRLVYASSAAVYGNPKSVPCREESAAQAKVLTPYALGKQYDEECADLFYRLYGIPTLGLRYFNVFGPRQSPDSPYSGVITKFVCSAFQNKKIIVYGDGKQTRDFVSVHDVVKANYLALTSNYRGVLNIGSGHRTSLLKLVSSIESIIQEKFNIAFHPQRKGDILHSVANINAAKKELNYQPEICLSAGLRGLLAGITCQ